jgi:hypothetical protein
MLTQAKLKEVLLYDQSTGIFTWKLKTLNTEIGQVAGSVRKTRDAYVRIGFEGETYFAHRLAWLYVHGKWPEKFIDHINGNESDNRIVNLREATALQNGRNIKKRVNNTVGLVGVSYDKERGKWIAQARENGRKKNLGRFNSQEEASAAYQSFARNHYGEFMRQEA